MRAGDDAKLELAARFQRRALDGVDARDRRHDVGQLVHEARDRGGAALDLNVDPGFVVAHEAAQREARREATDRRPEADALNGAAHAHATAKAWLRIGDGGHCSLTLSRPPRLALRAYP